MLLVVPEDFKYNWLALDVFNERLGHLHGNLEEKEPLMVQFSWERDAAGNSAGEAGGCKPVWSSASLTYPLPHGLGMLVPTKTAAKKSQHFQVEGSGFWSFPPPIHLV